MIIDKNLVLVSTPIIYRDDKRKRRWFIVKGSEEEKWHHPRVSVRKGESSVRAAMRLMGEQAAMSIKVLEEAGRAGGVTTINDKTFPQRHLYYLAKLKSSAEEAIGFEDSAWLEYAKAVRKLSSKRERAMIKSARRELSLWLKRREKKRKQEK